MHDRTRTLLIALAVALLVVAIVPPLFMAGMMASMMGGGMMGIAPLLFVAILLAGAVLLAIGLRR